MAGTTTKSTTKTTAAKDAAPEAEAPEQAPEPIPGTYANLDDALAAFQAHLPRIVKGQSASVQGREGRAGYTYDYADLTDVSDAVLPRLAAVGLAWHTDLDTDERDRVWVMWELSHGASDTRRSGRLPAGQAGGNWQQLGSAITYARRYALTAATGVAPGGDDDDAQAQSTAGSPRQEQRPQQTRPQQAPVQQNPERLPPGLYDLAITEANQARALYEKAGRAGHLAMLVGIRNPETGNIEGVPFGDWLMAEYTRLAPAPDEAPQPDPEDQERAAVLAYEASLDQQDQQVAREGAGAFPAGGAPEDNDIDRNGDEVTR